MYRRIAQAVLWAHPKGEQTPPSDLSMESSMLIRLCSDSLFNLADSLLNFSGILFCSAISCQVGVLGKLAGLLLDCAFDFVKLACCLIVRAGFHRGSLLCSVVVVDSLKSMDGYSHLDCLRPGKPLFGEVSLPIQNLVLTSIGLSDR